MNNTTAAIIYASALVAASLLYYNHVETLRKRTSRNATMQERHELVAIVASLSLDLNEEEIVQLLLRLDAMSVQPENKKLKVSLINKLNAR
jgi:hypothetical protein